MIIKRNNPNLRGYRVYEHREVCSNLIGRQLKKKEEVHHLNNIKSDNRPENLMAFSSKSAHIRFERGGKVLKKEIIFDGRNYHKNLSK